MPVRSLNLKLRLGRNSEGSAVRQSIWLTHSVVNEAIGEIQRILLLCRGTGYSNGDGDLVSAEDVQHGALVWARKLQEANGKGGAGSDDQVLDALRRFYEYLVPSILLNKEGKPHEADANKQAASFAGPIMDANSRGFQSVFGKVLAQLPDWVAAMQQGRTGWEKASELWLQTPESQRLQKAKNSPSAWVRRLRAGQPWQEAFVEDQAKKREEIHGVPSLVRLMKDELGLLPLMRPPIATRFDTPRTGLTPWDRLALRLALAHLLSWESWNHRAAADRRRVLDRRDLQAQKVAAYGDLVATLRTYETERHEGLKRLGLADDRRPFLIGIRATRAWERLCELWRKPGNTKQSRLDSVAKLQTRLRGQFGDPDLFCWLAEDGREALWRDAELLSALARLNALDRLLERKKERAIYTSPDAQAHPRWVLYAPAGAGNLREYRLDITNGTVVLTLPLLGSSGSGLCERSERILLAPSGQIETPHWNDAKGKERRLRFTCAHQQFSAQLGGGEILLRRRHLENRKREILDDGDIGAVWFKLVLNVDSQAPTILLNHRGQLTMPGVVHHFKTALVNDSKYIDELGPGLRILSIDLGIRTFAACSVFELVGRPPARRLAFLVDSDRQLWACHERSFLLPLPGESPDAATLDARRIAFAELATLRRGIRWLKEFLQISAKESCNERQMALERLVAGADDDLARNHKAAIDVTVLKSLDSLAALAQPHWQGEIEKHYREIEGVLGTEIGLWRKRTRPRASGKAPYAARRAYVAGKSMWAIEYLDAVRKLLQGWSLHGRRFGEIRRLDRDSQGTFAARLLDHINAIKDDRVKTGGDLIVQAARGFVPNKHRGWVKRYEPCQMILFEDLARYRFRTDRSRRENSRLMRWSHREIVAVTMMQGEVYGIGVDSIGAGFTSRFHARTGAPGYRTRVLSRDDVASPAITKQLELLADRLGIDVQRFTVGVRVPWEGGEEFATLGPRGELLVVHGDLNAAQNLQRRFWTRHSDAYRITAIEVNRQGRTFWYPDRAGPRLRGSLSLLVGADGYSRFVPAEDGEGFRIESVTKSHWTTATGGQADLKDESGLDEVDAELAEAIDSDESERGGRETFFRDPSGLVLPSERWYEAKVFWGRVQRRVAAALGLCGTVDGRQP